MRTRRYHRFLALGSLVGRALVLALVIMVVCIVVCIVSQVRVAVCRRGGRAMPCSRAAWSRFRTGGERTRTKALGEGAPPTLYKRSSCSDDSFLNVLDYWNIDLSVAPLPWDQHEELQLAEELQDEAVTVTRVKESRARDAVLG
jgi:hypothetical protein